MNTSPYAGLDNYQPGLAGTVESCLVLSRALPGKQFQHGPSQAASRVQNTALHPPPAVLSVLPYPRVTVKLQKQGRCASCLQPQSPCLLQRASTAGDRYTCLAPAPTQCHASPQSLPDSRHALQPPHTSPSIPRNNGQASVGLRPQAGGAKTNGCELALHRGLAQITAAPAAVMPQSCRCLPSLPHLTPSSRSWSPGR